MAKNQNSKIISHLYIHFPFCHSRCFYCSFYSVKYSNLLFKKYLKGLKKELNYYKENFNLSRIVTLYFGGGTPTLFHENLYSLYNAIASSIRLNSVKEFTIECNPYDISSQLVNTLQKIKCNRLSVGIQSFDKNILSNYNREGVIWETLIKKMELITNFKVNIDLINGFTNTNIDYELSHLNILLKKFDNIKHISFYDLSLPTTSIKDISSSFLNEKESLNYEKKFRNLIKKYGFNRYEVANYCKDNNKSVHNLGYWKYRNYIGLGPSAHSTIENLRIENKKNIEEYSTRVKNYKTIINLTKKEQIEEFLLMGLRLTEGINVKKFERRFNINFNNIFSDSFIKKLVKEKKIIYTKKRLYLTKEGMDILNKILLDIFVLLDKVKL